MEIVNCLLNSLVNGTVEHAEMLYRFGVIEMLKCALEYQESEAILVALEALKILFEYGNLYKDKYGNPFAVYFMVQKGKTVLENLAESIDIVIRNSATSLLKDYFTE